MVNWWKYKVIIRMLYKFKNIGNSCEYKENILFVFTTNVVGENLKEKEFCLCL